jgi:hypothetical protein
MTQPLILIPCPHRLKNRPGFFSPAGRATIAIPDHHFFPVAKGLKELFAGGAIRIGGDALPAAIRIRQDAAQPAEGYRLQITPKGIEVAAQDARGAFYALQTLRQIAARSPERLPCLEITDAPDFAERGIYYDVARGRVPKLERLMELAEQLAHYKINHLQLYIEHTFAFQGHPDIGKQASPLTAEDILKLDAFCRARHIELVPSLASFGHLATVLRHPRYRPLAEDYGVGRYADSEGKKLEARHRGWSLAPANPDVYRFLDSLFAEFLPLFSSGRFNVCCDETYDLGLGQSHKLAQKIGKGRLYLGHLKQVEKLAAKYGKQIMFWGDIIRHYPELIPEIPKQAMVLDWGYSHNHPFDRIRDFRKAGLEFFACPGTSSWVSLFPRLRESRENIAAFAQAGHRHGARGLLTTDWGDGGHYNFMEYSWYGYLFGAEQGWNLKAPDASFTARFAATFFNSRQKALAAAIDELGDITHRSVHGHYQSVWQHLFFATPEHDLFDSRLRKTWVVKNGRIREVNARLDARLGKDTLRRLDHIRDVFTDASRENGSDPHGILPYWIFAVDTLAHAAGKLAAFGGGGEPTAAQRRELRGELQQLMRRFQVLWHARNRPSEIRVTLKRYRLAIKGLTA